MNIRYGLTEVVFYTDDGKVNLYVSGKLLRQVLASQESTQISVEKFGEFDGIRHTTATVEFNYICFSYKNLLYYFDETARKIIAYLYKPKKGEK
jgi:hypothetical protein